MLLSQDWLYDSTDIIAHIFFAVGTIDQVVLTTPHADFVGVMCYPDDDGILIVLEERLADSGPGTPVCVEYTGPGDQYRFYSEVLSVEPRGLRIALPRAVERNDRRLTERHPVPANAGFEFRATGLPDAPVFGVHDLSTGGMALFDMPTPAPVSGDLMTGDLCLPGEEPIPMCLEVRHLQLRRGQLLLGSRITAITTLGRGRLAKFLVKWKPRSA